LPKAGLKFFGWAFLQGSKVVILLNFCAKNPRLRQAPKRQAVKKLATLQKIAQTSVIPALNLAFAQCAF
jgi:hypothetical protein